jgi:organic hydroperoxide reductase OsmC/OhrA
MSTTVQYRLLPATRAAVGRSGNHIVIADRPEGKAGGMGLGFNGGELLALAIGGCFCNDLQVLADELGLTITGLEISVTLQFDGSPSRTTDAKMSVACTLADGADPTELIERAKKLTNIGNSVRAGIPFEIEARDLGQA